MTFVCSLKALNRFEALNIQISDLFRYFDTLCIKPISFTNVNDICNAFSHFVLVSTFSRKLLDISRDSCRIYNRCDFFVTRYYKDHCRQMKRVIGVLVS